MALENKLGITNSAELAREEERLSKKKALELYDTGVLDQLEAAINQYQIVSVADLYDLAGITCRSYTANKYGWTDLQSAKVVRTRDGYILQLPRTVQIN